MVAGFSYSQFLIFHKKIKIKVIAERLSTRVSSPMAGQVSTVRPAETAVCHYVVEIV